MVPYLSVASAFVEALGPIWPRIVFHKAWPSLAPRAPELSTPHPPTLRDNPSNIKDIVRSVARRIQTRPPSLAIPRERKEAGLIDLGYLLQTPRRAADGDLSRRDRRRQFDVPAFERILFVQSRRAGVLASYLLITQDAQLPLQAHGYQDCLGSRRSRSGRQHLSSD